VAGHPVPGADTRAVRAALPLGVRRAYFTAQRKLDGDAAGRSLQRADGFCETAGSLPTGDLQERFRSHRAVQAVWPEQIAAVAASFATPGGAAAFLLDKF